MRTRFAGPVTGGLMAAVMAGLLLMTELEDSAYGLYAVALIAMLVLAPLLVVNLVTTVVYLLRGTVPGRVYVLMWLPALLILLSVSLLSIMGELRHMAFQATHPNIREVHVNLSGRSVWLDPEGAGRSSGAELPGTTLEKFRSLTRYAGGDDTMSAYVQARLADDFREMRVFLGPPATTAPTILQVRRPVPFPAVDTFLGHHSMEGGEAAVIEYDYYYYTDHVDVVPAITLSGSQEMGLWGSGLPLVDFHLVNLTTQPIARLEINGQGVSLGQSASIPENKADCCCGNRNRSVHAVNKLDGPLTVRWQLAEPNPVWHETTVTVAQFGRSPIKGRIRSTSVDLFFQNDGTVTAEAYQLVDISVDIIAVRAHAPISLQNEPPCGRSPAFFVDEASILRE